MANTSSRISSKIRNHLLHWFDCSAVLAWTPSGAELPTDLIAKYYMCLREMPVHSGRAGCSRLLQREWPGLSRRAGAGAGLRTSAAQMQSSPPPLFSFFLKIFRHHTWCFPSPRQAEDTQAAPTAQGLAEKAATLRRELPGEETASWVPPHGTQRWAVVCDNPRAQRSKSRHLAQLGEVPSHLQRILCLNLKWFYQPPRLPTEAKTQETLRSSPHYN